MPTGTDGADTLTGVYGYYETLEGLGGDDRLEARNFEFSNVGDQTRLLGGAGNDTLVGGVNSYDTLDGGSGDDRIIGQDERSYDYVAFSGATAGVRVNLGDSAPQDVGGGQGVDVITGISGALGTPYGDTIAGGEAYGAGYHLLWGAAGDDSLSGGSGADFLNAEAGNDTVVGGGGADDLSGGAGDDRLSGGAGNDTFHLDNHYGRDTFDLVEERGDDVIDGGDGVDRVTLGPYGYGGFVIDLRLTTPQAQSQGLGAKTFISIEEIVGGVGDTLTGTDGANLLSDQYGDGRLSGLGGDDVLQSGDGAATLLGGSGNDTLNGYGGGDKLLDGGDGIDTAALSAGEIDLAAGTARSGSSLVRLLSIENVSVSFGNSRITGDAGGNVLNSGFFGYDSLFGGGGDDTITAVAGSNYLRGDDGADVIRGGVGFDDINGNVGDDTARGGQGGDWVVGGKDNDLLFGEAGDDIVYGNLGSDTCEGGDGADLVRGGQGDDILSGGAGNDWLSGDRGDDTVTGGVGADIFHSFQGAGLDRVTDFHIADGDRVQLDPGTSYTVEQIGADTVVQIQGGDRLVLVDVQLSSLQSGWIFGA